MEARTAPLAHTRPWRLTTAVLFDGEYHLGGLNQDITFTMVITLPGQSDSTRFEAADMCATASGSSSR
jgi:hypothetical protein